MTNPDKAIPEFQIDLPWGKEDVLFSLEAFCVLEELTGKNALDGETWSKPDVRLLSTVLWAGLVDKKGMSVVDLRKKLTLPQLIGLWGEINKAFLRASPAPDEKKSDAA